MLSKVLGGMIVAAALLGMTAVAEQSSTIKGTVFSSKTSSGAKIVTLTAPGGNYTVVIDDRGKSLASDMDGKKAEVVGIVTKEGNTNMLRVLSYNPILTGRVEATMDQAGAVTMVRLITPDRTYEIVLDDKGIELGKKMGGQMVDAVGTINKKKILFIGKNEFIVKSFEHHKEAG